MLNSLKSKIRTNGENDREHFADADSYGYVETRVNEGGGGTSSNFVRDGSHINHT